jgi:hypothetical protein
MIGATREAGRRAGAVRAVFVVAAAMIVALAGAQAASASWVLLVPPAPAGSTGAGMGAVSCSATTSCVALGGALTTGGGSVAFADAWNGTTWTEQNLADAADADMFGVSCAAPAACTAVGRHAQSLLPLAERWDGTGWTVQSTPALPGTTNGTLAGVACGSQSNCVAVGYATVATEAAPFSESWNGTGWTAHSAPLPPGATSGEFLGVSCHSRWSCMAVGEFRNSSGFSPLAESWAGGHWTLRTAPSPAGDSFVALDGVSCRAVTMCMAVGRGGTGPVSQPLAERWNGATWTIVAIPRLGGPSAAANFASVSCSRVYRCAAVGDFGREGHVSVLAESWTGGTEWGVDAIVKPSGSQFSALNGLSCPLTSHCLAVGGYRTARGTGVPLAEQDS